LLNLVDLFSSPDDKKQYANEVEKKDNEEPAEFSSSIVKPAVGKSYQCNTPDNKKKQEDEEGCSFGESRGYLKSEHGCSV
jgi:hypothetical protein